MQDHGYAHSTETTGFDYMANHGQEEQDRDMVGMGIALVLMFVLTVFQYLGLY